MSDKSRSGLGLAFFHDGQSEKAKAELGASGQAVDKLITKES
jgi:hypothetical protein